MKAAYQQIAPLLVTNPLHAPNTMKQRSQHLTSGLKMLGIFMLLALFSSAFAQEAAEAPQYADLAAF